jgi:diguanylate cyclase (GGDEF)-like protein/PAS domain S-box-containing protein
VRFDEFFEGVGLGTWLVGLSILFGMIMALRPRLARAQRRAVVEAADRAGYERLRLVADNLPALVGYVDTAERFQFANRAYDDWFAKPPAELVGRTVRETWGEAAYAVIQPNMARALKGERVTYEYNFPDREGRERQVLAEYVPDVGSDGAVRGFFVLGTDITPLARHRRELHLEKERLEHALEGSHAALWDTDLRTSRVYLSEAWSQILGRSAGETITTTRELAQLAHPDDLDAIQRASLEAVKGARPAYAVEHRVRAANGEWRWIISRGRVTERDPATGRALRMIGTNLDITDRKRVEQALESVAQTDPLTGVANRTLLHDRLKLASARARRTGSRCALLYLDVDRFKQVNDVHGHAAGDALLKGIAARLRACVRQTDTVARVGGDEFVVLLEELKDGTDAATIAQKILEQAKQPLHLNGHSLAVSTSIGLAYSAGDLEDQDWLHRADLALYEAKKAGRDTYRVSVAT